MPTALGLGRGSCSPSGSRTHGLVPALHGAGQEGPISERFYRLHPPQSTLVGAAPELSRASEIPSPGARLLEQQGPSFLGLHPARPSCAVGLFSREWAPHTDACGKFHTPSTERSLLPSSFTRHRCPSLCLGAADSLPQKDPCPPPRQPPDALGHSPCMPALLCRPVLYGPPSPRAPGHLPA